MKKKAERAQFIQRLLNQTLDFSHCRAVGPTDPKFLVDADKFKKGAHQVLSS